MKAFLVAALLSFLVQQEPEPYPGQRGHAMPPDGWFCSHDSKEPAHKCQCKRMARPAPGDPCCDNVKDEDIIESDQCKVYCHKDHCHCPVQCKMEH